MSYKIPSILDMLKAGVHFGHQSNKWHPKMAPFIFTQRNNIHIFDLEQTQAKLAEALEYLKNAASQNRTILFIGTKEQAKPIIKKYAEEAGIPFITERWLGGLLTNFDEIHQTLFKKYKKLKSLKETNEITKYTKKEQVHLMKELEKLDKYLGSIEKMDKRPDIVFIVDLKIEKTAFEEAQKTGIKIVAFCDSNTNPEKVDYPIPANDDATNSIEMLVKLATEAIKEGRANLTVTPTVKETTTEGKKKETVSRIFNE